MHADTILTVVAVLEFVVILAFVANGQRTSARERLLQRDVERLQTINTNLVDRTMHTLERTWTPPPADVAQRDPDDDDLPPHVLSLEETGFEDDELFQRAVRSELEARMAGAK